MLMRPAKCEADARYDKTEVEAKAKKTLRGQGQTTNLNSTQEILQ